MSNQPRIKETLLLLTNWQLEPTHAVYFRKTTHHRTVTVDPGDRQCSQAWGQLAQRRMAPRRQLLPAKVEALQVRQRANYAQQIRPQGIGLAEHKVLQRELQRHKFVCWVPYGTIIRTVICCPDRTWGNSSHLLNGRDPDLIPRPSPSSDKREVQALKGRVPCSVDPGGPGGGGGTQRLDRASGS